MEKDKNLVVAVVGSRSVKSCPALLVRLAELAPDQVVSGGATGVDALAASWARANRVPLLELRPDYATHGPTAPHVRNAAVVAAADVVLVVWDGASPPQRGPDAERGAGGGAPGPALRVAADAGPWGAARAWGAGPVRAGTWAVPTPCLRCLA